jgi:putative Ca2+/H+ antiporter (TMEM165/GDT1 family)
VIDLVVAVAIAFGVVFVAELGDKTQLLALNFGSRYPLGLVALGLAVGYGIANLLATMVGGVLGAALPERPIELVGGAVFFVFAALALRSDAAHGGSVSDTGVARRSVVISVALAIAVAEMGDKTQIATATLAAQSHPAAIWVGSTLGAAASGTVGAAAGNLVGDRIPQRPLQLLSAALFAAFGVAMIAGWL